MMSEIKTASRRLEELSREASMEHRTMRDALDAERGAKAALLDLLVAAIAPVLPDISSKVPSAAAGPSAEYGREPLEFFDFRGVLAAGTAGPNAPDERVAFEKLAGKGLFVAEDGRLVEVEYGGEFARAGAYAWRGTGTVLTSLDAIDRRWSIGEVFETIAEEIEVQIEGKQKATAKSEARTKAVRAAAALLKGVR